MIFGPYGIVWRARYTGAYYAGVQVSVATTPLLFGDYLLSIAENCRIGAQMSADLSVAIAASPDPVAARAEITYTITVTSQGPDLALDATVTSPVPADTTFVSMTPPAGWTCGVQAGVVSCTTPCLVSGSPQVFSMVVRVNQCAGTGTVISGSASVGSKFADGVPANNSATATVTVQDDGVCDDADACTTGDACNGGTCAGTAIPAPGEVANVRLQGDKKTLTWSSIPGGVPGTVYDVPRGLLGELPVGAGAAETCVAPGVAGAITEDTLQPDVSQGFWYLVRCRHACGTGTYGHRAVRGVPAAERITVVCP